MTIGSFSLDIPESWWLNSNHRHHRMVVADRTKNIREAARLQFRRMKKVPTPANVLAMIHTPTNGRFDPPNAWPTVKAMIDGIVDAGILADDSSKHIPVTSFTRGMKTGIKGRYQITLYFTKTKGK